MSDGPGYFFCLGACFVCGLPFMFNPDTITCPIVDNRPETICERCMQLVNAERVKNGVPAFPILPGAYQPAEGP